MQMQLDRKSSYERLRHRGVRHHSVGEIGVLARQLDAESYADAFVAPRPWACQEVRGGHTSTANIQISEIDRFVPTPDDQDGIRLLYKPEVPDVYPVLARYGATAELAEALVVSAGGGLSHNLRQLHYEQ